MPFVKLQRASYRERSMTLIHGDVAEGFGPVADAFADNFDQRGEVGAAFCLYLGGSSVVDTPFVVSGNDSPADRPLSSHL